MPTKAPETKKTRSSKLSKRIGAYGKMHMMLIKRPPWGLTGYFLDLELFRLLAHSARLQLPLQPLRIRLGGDRLGASPSTCN